ncbi:MULTISPECIES: hypothetical protein [Pseudomonas]|uniref:hypothetical protein n=1 Tax=Pseudomonas TaxID=286 RepID=UPI0012FD16B7|nr:MULTISPECIES: hypothetical protein [Pseudomonas]
MNSWLAGEKTGNVAITKEKDIKAARLAVDSYQNVATSTLPPRALCSFLVTYLKSRVFQPGVQRYHDADFFPR